MPSPYPEPFLIQFPSIGDSGIGFITVGQFSARLPFQVARMFWTYDTPTNVMRGQHAHHTTEEVIVALRGTITIEIETRGTGLQTIVLDRPDQGLYRPPHAWTTMRYSDGAVQLAFASTDFDESDYIRDYQTFQQTWMR